MGVGGGGRCRSHPLTRKEGRAGEPAGGRGLWLRPRPQPDWAPEQRRWVCAGDPPATTRWGCRGPRVHSQGPRALGRCSEHDRPAGQGGAGAPRDCLLTSVREGCLWGARGGSCYFLRPPLFSDLRRTMPGFPMDQQWLEVRGVGKGPAAGQGLGWTVVLGPVHGGANQLSLDGSSLVSKGRGRQPHDGGERRGCWGSSRGTGSSPGCRRVTECKAPCVHGCVCPWGHPGRTPCPRAWVCSPVKQASPRAPEQRVHVASPPATVTGVASPLL